MTDEIRLDLWKGKPAYTIQEAAWLWAHVAAGIPLFPETAREQRRYRSACNEAEQQIRHYMRDHGLSLEVEKYEQEVWRTNPQRRTRYKTVESRTRELITHARLAEFAAHRGKAGAFDLESTGAGNAEWGFTYDTPLLKAVRTVVRDYYEGIDPDKPPPKKDRLVPEIAERFGITANMADAVDRVTRPYDRTRGGARKG